MSFSVASQFDSPVAKTIARLPDYCKLPFHYLGVVFIPTSWALSLLGYIIITKQFTPISAGELSLLCVPLATIGKLAFRRQRPPTIYAGNMRIKSYSFPSSHAYSAALSGGFFAHLALIHQLPLVAFLLLALITIIGVSRVYLGAHYPSDVVGGWLIGFLLLGAILASV